VNRPPWVFEPKRSYGGFDQKPTGSLLLAETTVATSKNPMSKQNNDCGCSGEPSRTAFQDHHNGHPALDDADSAEKAWYAREWINDHENVVYVPSEKDGNGEFYSCENGTWENSGKQKARRGRRTTVGTVLRERRPYPTSWTGEPE